MNTPISINAMRIALTHGNRADAPLIPFEQIRVVAAAAVHHGVRRFELCGGEPLEREDIPVLCMMLSSLTVLDDMSLTTGGVLLPRWAKALRGAGVQHVTVKLDTFDPVKYRAMTNGGDMTAVLAGIRSLMEVGFPPATIEARLIGGVNDSELPSLVRLTKMTGVSLRLMELTQEEADALCGGLRLSCADALALLPELVCEESGVYRLPGADGTVMLVPCGEREKGVMILDADGTLRAGSQAVCAREMDEDAARKAIDALLHAGNMQTL